jgi:hypothetical protein
LGQVVQVFRAALLLMAGIALYAISLPAAAVAEDKPVVIGQLGSPEYDCTGPNSYFQTGTASGASYTVPFDGTLTAWRFQSGADPVPNLKLKVGRAAGGGAYLVTGESPAGIQSLNSINSYPAAIPVQKGDLIGISQNGGNCAVKTESASDTAVAHQADVAPGDTVSFESFGNFYFPVQATIVPNPPKVVHYAVELKAWIPKREVAGFPPVSTPYSLPHGPDCLDPGGTAFELATMVSSTFQGDGHPGYDRPEFVGLLDTGGFRVRPVAHFDLADGKIENFTVSSFPQSVGTTHKHLTYSTYPSKTRECTIEKTATQAAGGRMTSATSFELFISSSNPLAPGAPAIDSTLKAFFTSDERLTLDYDTDLFPSHGIRVKRNGDVDTFVVNDVACLADDAVLGLPGAGLLAYGLTRHGNLGSESVIPNEQSLTITRSGRLCDTDYRIVDVAPLASPAGAEASAAGGIEVAPLLGPGKGRFVPLSRAVELGLVGATTFKGRTQLAADAANPVSLRVKGRRLALETTDVDRGRPAHEVLYGPAKGPLMVTLDDKIMVMRGKKTLSRRRPDTKPPRTTAKLKRTGKTIAIRFAAHDLTGVQSTFVTIGKRAAQLRRGVLKVPARKLRQIRFFSVDIYGNREKPRRVKRG